MTILLVGFGPFSNIRHNPSGEIAKLLNGKRIGNDVVLGRVLPVSYTKVKVTLERLITDVNPSLFLGVGLAPNSTCIRVEAIALNIAYSEKPDVDGTTMKEITSIYDDGDLAYMATIPLKRVIDELRRHGIPSVLSFSAGTYLCNYAYYIASYILSKKNNAMFGFIHIPQASEYVTSKANAPSLPFNVLVRAVEITIHTSLGLPYGKSVN